MNSYEIKKLYEKDIANLQPLKLEEIDVLLEKTKNGDIQAKQELILHMQKLIIRQVYRMHEDLELGPINKNNYMDYILEGNLALNNAIDMYNLKPKNVFINYARKYIYYAILKFWKDFTHPLILPYKQIKAREEKIGDYLKKTYLKYEIEYNIKTVDEYGKVVNEKDALRIKTYKQVLNEIKQRDCEIFKRIYGLDPFEKMKMKDIAKLTGLSKGRISQIQKTIIRKIQKEYAENLKKIKKS